MAAIQLQNGGCSVVRLEIVVADDVQAAQGCREQDGGEIGRRERCGHRHAGQGHSQLQRGFDAFACGHDVHRAALRGDRRLAEMGRREPVRVQPGALRAGDPAIAIGDGRDQGRPSVHRAVGIGSVVAARVIRYLGIALEAAQEISKGVEM